MTYNEEKSEWTLSTGKIFYGHTEHLSVKENSFVYGYAGSVHESGSRYGSDLCLTLEERKEIAQHMIDRWNTWATLGGNE